MLPNQFFRNPRFEINLTILSMLQTLTNLYSLKIPITTKLRKSSQKSVESRQKQINRKIPKSPYLFFFNPNFSHWKPFILPRNMRLTYMYICGGDGVSYIGVY